MSELDNVKFNGDKLFQNRQDRGLSQGKLAAKIGVSRQTIYLWESNQSLPDVEKVGKICKILKINLSDLMDGVEEQKTIEEGNKVVNEVSEPKEVGYEPVNDTDNIIEENSNEITALIIKEDLPKKRKSKKIVIKIIAFILLIILIIHITLSTIKFVRLNTIIDKWKRLNEIETYYIKIKKIYLNKDNDIISATLREIFYNNGVLKTIVKDENDEKIKRVMIDDYNNKVKYVIDEQSKTYKVQALDKQKIKLTDNFEDFFFISNNKLVNYLICLRPDISISYNEVYEINIGKKYKEYIEREAGLVIHKENIDDDLQLINQYYTYDFSGKDFEINLDEYTELKGEN